MNFRAAQANFSRGELAPQLHGRFDVDAYQAALRRARNVLVLKYGGVTKRPGTEFVAEVIDATHDNRLIAFQFSLTQAYVLEFGEGYMSPCANGGRVLDGGAPYVVTSPYAAADLAEVDTVQTTDTVYLAHLAHPPTKLLRHGATDWEFVAVTFGPSQEGLVTISVAASVNNMDSDNDGVNYFPQPASYVVTCVNDDTGEESRASAADTCTNDLTLKRNFNTISWAAIPGATRYNVYKADNSQFFGYIGTTEALTFTDDNIGPALDKAPPQANNPFAAPGDYPSTVTLFEQRSIWGRTTNAPNGIWGSRSAQLENMDRSRPLRADDSFAIAIAASRVNAVNQLVPTTALIALTSDGIFKIDGDGQGGVIQANSSPAARRQLGRAASRLDALAIDNVIFYCPFPGASVRTANYSFDIDGLKSNDVTIYSPHFLQGFSIVSWCYAQEPRSLIWAARDDGKLLCFTWEQEQNVWGWTLCETDGLVKSVCSIVEGGEDRVYMIVERVIGGVTRRFVERVARHLWDDADLAVYLDCAVAGEVGTPAATFTGLDHLNGATVTGLVDGVMFRDLVVSGGAVTLPAGNVGTKAVFGLPYLVEVESLPLRLMTKDTGSNIGRRQQVGEIWMTLADTGLIEAGVDANHLFPVKQRLGEAYGTADVLMTGDYGVVADNRVGDTAGVYVRQNAPLPLTILGIAFDPIVNG